MKKLTVYSYCFCLLFVWGCASTNEPSQTDRSNQTYYTSSFPSQNVTEQLRNIQRSVFRISATILYNTYFFEDRQITLQNIRSSKQLDTLATRRSAIDHNKAGTAISILQNENNTLLITALHALSFPDTVVVFKKGRNIPERKFVESIGIKNKQRNYLITNKEVLGIDIVAEDIARDLALVELNRPEYDSSIPPLPIKAGKARNLRLGSFLYILGYPLGSQMITRGIVSAPNYDRGGSFLTDALFNHGISGGLIIGSRNNYRSFEWVGMALTASASEQQFLIPDPSRSEQYEDFEAYVDTPFVSEKRVINYGVTNARPIEQIIEFLLRNEDKLQNRGLSVKDLSY